MDIALVTLQVVQIAPTTLYEHLELMTAFVAHFFNKNTNHKYLTHGLALYLTEQSELVVWKKAICFIEKKISSNKLFEAPVFSLDESIGSLAF